MLGNKLVTGSTDESLRVWGMLRGAETWECERVLEDHTADVDAVTCTRDGRRLLGCDDWKQMLLWEESEDRA